MVSLASVPYYTFNCLSASLEGLKKSYSFFVSICNNLRTLSVVGEDWRDPLNACWNTI